MERLRDILDVGGRRRVPFIRQSEGGECGLACIAMVANYYGLPDTLPSLRSRFAPSLQGMTMRRIVTIAEAIGLRTEAVRVELEAVATLRLPAILHWDLRHFVVLTRVVRSFGKTEFEIIDPGAGERRVSLDTLSGYFTGVALEVWMDAPLPQKKDRPIPFSSLWRGMSGVRKSALQITLLSLLYQSFVLVVPALSQWGIDAIVPSADRSLLATFIVVVVILSLLAAVSAYVRLQALLILSTGITFHIVRGVFDSLVKRRIEWFQKRSVADIVSRFASVRPIAKSMSTLVASLFIDGFTALTALVLMLTYSWMLGLVAMVGSALVVGYRIILLRSVIRRSERGIAADAAENGNLMETIRGIQAIKLFNMEGARRQTWLGLKTRSLNAQTKLGQRSALLDVGSTLLSEIDRAVVMVLALLLIINGTFTLGMMVAFAAYAQFFRTAVTKLSELWIEFGVARLHLERVSDIIEANPADIESALVPLEEALTFESLELRDVSFRYAQGDPLVLSGVNLRIERGDTVVFVGPSGGGKTTLFKILFGALQPESGQILLNGRPLQPEHMREFRSIIGVVSQDDVLYAGTIMDNISFFDPMLDPDVVAQAAITAQISDEIFKMPMTFQSLVGDMGSALSGGQKQRLLLARALYRRPQIIFMDEGTSHLDVETERQVHSNLAQCDLTMVSVAHRPHALAVAKRTLSVCDGKITELASRGQTPPFRPAVAISE